MNKIIPLLLIPLLMTGCTTMGVGTAEMTGIALFHDRRSTQAILIDEKIEHDALLSLNLDSNVRENSHFNATSYNGIVLLTGETAVPALIPYISNIVQSLSDVRFVRNQMLVAPASAWGNRADDSMITAKLKIALSSDPRLPGFDTTRIKVVTENGRVFLMGLVYKQESDVVAEIAQKQPNVREVIKVFEYL